MPGMRTEFHDKDMNTDYDKAIEESRKRMESQNPIERVAEIQLLISKLQIMKDLYWSRFPEGVNLGIFTPHRSRIDRRIKAFELEKAVHVLEKEEFLREEGRKYDMQVLEKNHKLKLEQHRITIEAAREATKTIRIEEKGVSIMKTATPLSSKM